MRLLLTCGRLLADLLRLLRLRTLADSDKDARILFLEKQLAFYVERGIKPRRLDAAAKLTIAFLYKTFDLRSALVVVKPATVVTWHRQVFRLLWRRRSRPIGRPPIPAELRALIAEMLRGNPSWGQGRVRDELALKLGLRVSPRTVRKYWPRGVAPAGRRGEQRWATFVRNHAAQTVACDFFTVVTATLRTVYVFLAMDIGSRRILHFNITRNPTALWTLQQFRELLPAEHPFRFVLHDRDAIFSKDLDASVQAMRVRVLRSPAHAPQANAFCERLIGTVRRECLDWLIPLGRRHLHRILTEWVKHYNRGRPHSSLGPGIPETGTSRSVPLAGDRHRLAPGVRVVSSTVLGGLHHEYRLEKAA